MKDSQLVKDFNILLSNFSRFKKVKPLRGIEDIKKVPLTAREDVKAWSLADCPRQPVEMKRTAGFTGESVFIFMSGEARKAFIVRCKEVLKMAGLRKGDVIINFSYPEPFAAFSESAIQSGLTLIPFGPLDNQLKEELALEIIDTVKPKAVFAYPHQVYQLFSKRGQTSVKICICGGEALLPGLRDYIKKRNKIDMYDCYGANEVNTIAAQKHPEDEYMQILSGMHILVMNKEGVLADEGEGEIVITDLYNFSSPIINYRLGDSVILKKSGAAQLIKIIGRKEPFFLYNGEVFSKTDAIDCAFRSVQNMEFVIVMKKDALFRDDMTIYLEKKDAAKVQEVKERFNKKNLFPHVKLMEKLEKVRQGRKTTSFIDMRNKR